MAPRHSLLMEHKRSMRLTPIQFLGKRRRDLTWPRQGIRHHGLEAGVPDARDGLGVVEVHLLPQAKEKMNRSRS